MPSPALTSDAPSAEPALRLLDVQRSLGRGRRRSAVLHGVDLTARRGAVTVLLGPNGAGKSTTLAICHGTDRPDSGTVRVFGRDPWRAGADLRARVWGRQTDTVPPVAAGAAFGLHVLGFLRPDAGAETSVHTAGPWTRVATDRGFVLTR